jgi:hypothetical protein
MFTHYILLFDVGLNLETTQNCGLLFAYIQIWSCFWSSISQCIHVVCLCLQIWFNFFSIIFKLETLGEWRRQQWSTKVKDIQTLRVTDKCFISVSSMSWKVMENTYDVIFESQLLYGVCIWWVERGMGNHWWNSYKILKESSNKSRA